MKINNLHRSPNFEEKIIPVEFIVLHYTACNLKRALGIFFSPTSKVAAHFVIDESGEIYDLGDFKNGDIRKGAHAGESNFTLDGKNYEGLNACSVGIEIVNLNGNIFDYTEAQYQALKELTSHLIARFPILSDPNRIVGHEHIAGFRGKADPGAKFDWPRFYRSVYGERAFPKRAAICPPEKIDQMATFIRNAKEVEKEDPQYWSWLSSDLEKFLDKRGK